MRLTWDSRCPTSRLRVQRLTPASSCSSPLQGPRNATGYLTPEADHFPNGMKVVVDYAHANNLSFGLYTCGGSETCVGGRPGSMGYWTQDAQVWAEWGVDWVKMDW